MLKTLLQASVDPNQLDSNDNTPLHIAAKNGDSTAIQMLLLAGGNLDLQNAQSKRPIDMLPPMRPAKYNALRTQLVPLAQRPAVRNVLQPDAQLLEKRTRNTPLHIAAATNNVSHMSEMLARGEDINIQNNKGETPAMIAAQKGAKTLIALDYLTQRPMFNYTIRDKMRNGLLHHAAASGNLDSVRLLIQKFPYINKEERNSFGQTPLEIAMQKGNVDVYKYLMSLVGHAKSTWRDGSCYNPSNIIPKIPFQQNPYMQQVMAPNGQMVNLY
jgi:ankyrin repeat protein